MRLTNIIVFILTLIFINNLFALSREEKIILISSRVPTHYQTKNNPNGCKTCHASTGYVGGDEEKQCYFCHSKKSKMMLSQKKLKIKSLQAKDTEEDFNKPYRHPVEKQAIYNALQKYPIVDPKTPRYSECIDCHHPHYSIPEMPFLGTSGIGIDGKYKQFADEEYEVCFKCHGSGNNKPAYQKDKQREFDPKNPSFHPVVDVGKNNYLPSLDKNLNYESKIKCSDCHGSDERNPNRSSGVHGSENDYLLVLPYTKKEEVMIPKFDLCYKCHRKESILGNQSFPYHREHIEGVKSRNWRGTSCSTCHNVHGSTKYKFLIEFNPDYVQKDSSSNKIEFLSEGIFKGSCYLKCHNVDHSPKRYGIGK
jgi:hypothetical protein